MHKLLSPIAQLIQVGKTYRNFKTSVRVEVLAVSLSANSSFEGFKNGQELVTFRELEVYGNGVFTETVADFWKFDYYSNLGWQQRFSLCKDQDCQLEQFNSGRKRQNTKK